MGFLGTLRCVVRPLSRLSHTSASASATTSTHPSSTSFLARNPRFQHSFGGGPLPAPLPIQFLSRHFSIFAEDSNRFNSLTDTRYPKRRPLLKPCRKRASLRPPGPYAWVKYVPGQPIQPNNPNEGSVKRRNEKKRIKLRRAFIKAEAKKRKAQMQEAKRKKNTKRVERKMAAVAREREWAQKLAELQRLEEEKKSMA